MNPHQIISYSLIALTGALFYLNPLPLFLGMAVLSFLNLFHLRYIGNPESEEYKNLRVEIDELSQLARDASDRAGEIALATGLRPAAGSR